MWKQNVLRYNSDLLFDNNKIFLHWQYLIFATVFCWVLPFLLTTSILYMCICICIMTMTFFILLILKIKLLFKIWTFYFCFCVNWINYIKRTCYDVKILVFWNHTMEAYKTSYTQALAILDTSLILHQPRVDNFEIL